MSRSLKRRLTRKVTRQQLRTFLEKHQTEKFVLDVGTKNCNYHDLFPNVVAGDIAYYPCIHLQFDAHTLPFPAATFDTVLCAEVLEHCLNPQQVIDEFYRVLRPEGVLLLSTRFLFPIHDAPHDYYRYTKYGLMHLCRRFEHVDVIPEVETVETIAVLLQRLASQVDWKLPGTKLLLQLLTRVVMRLQWNVKAEYGDVSRRAGEQTIMTSGYYLVAQKGR